MLERPESGHFFARNRRGCNIMRVETSWRALGATVWRDIDSGASGKRYASYRAVFNGHFCGNFSAKNFVGRCDG